MTGNEKNTGTILVATFSPQMSFTEAISIGIRKYATFGGRASRAEYWQFRLAIALTFSVAIYIDPILRASIDLDRAYFPTITLFAVLTFFPILTSDWRRMHDVGMAGWTVHIPSFLAIIVLLSPLWMDWLLSTFIHERWSVLLAAQSRRFISENESVIFIWLATSAVLYLMPVWWLTRRSQPGSNRYGPNPLEVTP